ncbi:unnamed protein product [Didymodactylos carnosus]|uniref:Troponin I n=1 Tax=Didymodactylos carnosus TaxID=1234261 RepID=A0A815E1I4_9BILA|nr:unnamed protein product [Didymodactylos carnosus]CAF1305170.1 unnamed protein product [Didymodactylos carnosus]CAF3934508.1 unnamed protein product [Didymodactylos carnosus]CAF4137290.1 unnamed protein product [Didymodactylos carnosus]
MAHEGLTEDEQKARKKADRERKRQEARDVAEKKKRFGLTPEKKRKLRLLIMKMATDNLKNAAQQRLEARKNYIAERVKPLPTDFNSLTEAHLVSILKDLHKQLTEQEEASYDVEMKIRKQDYDINELTIKVNDIKGKFIKPTLKKVSKTEQKMHKLQKPKEEEMDFRSVLKVSNKPKFALNTEEKEEEKVNFREHLKSAKEHKVEEED